ncbi:uncharacterized protein BCR38DRAFT_452547, partial [Pseudomassariella vexata]
MLQSRLFGTAFAFISIMAFLFSPIINRLKVLGAIGRGQIKNIHGQNTKVIQGTLFTEDLHYHHPSGYLFGASEPNEDNRNTWFPPLV